MCNKAERLENHNFIRSNKGVRVKHKKLAVSSSREQTANQLEYASKTKDLLFGKWKYSKKRWNRGEFIWQLEELHGGNKYPTPVEG